MTKQVSVSEAAKIIGVNRSYIQAEILAGRLASKKVGRQHVIEFDDLQTWATGNERPTRKRKMKIEADEN